MHRSIRRQLGVSAMAISLGFLGAANCAFASDPGELVTKAQSTFSDFKADRQTGWIQEHLRDAKAVMIAPDIRKAGLVVGVSTGRAVLLARDPATGEFSGPAFYRISSASVGFQAGIEQSEVVMLIMTEKGLNALLSPQLKFGADASIAAGPVGTGAERSITTDVVAFSKDTGIYGGVNLSGTVVTVNHEWNKDYYGKTATPTDILIRHSVSNPDARRLLDRMADAKN